MSKQCLNCTAQVSGKFCANCGQKANTHRIDLKHFFLHDLLHGVWHFEKGILFTIKEIIVRPGKAGLDYISGKRIRYYNVFYLSLLLIGLNVLLVHFYGDVIQYKYAPAKNVEVFNFLAKYVNFVLFGMVPFFALSAKFIFRRLKLNTAEHFIMGGIALAGILLFFFLLKSFDFLNKYFDLWIFQIFEILAFMSMIAFPLWTYFNATRQLYSLAGFGWRIVFFLSDGGSDDGNSTRAYRRLGFQ